MDYHLMFVLLLVVKGGFVGAVPPLILTVNDGSEPVYDGTTVYGVEVTLKCSYTSQTLDDDIRIQYKPRDAADSEFEDATAISVGLNRWSDSTKYKVTRSIRDPFFTQLKIKSASYDDEGVYRCRATDGTDTTTSSNVQLEILVAPSVSCSPAEHRASKGTTVEFTCTITGNPLPDDKDISWTGLIDATQALVPIAARDKNIVLGIESTVTRGSNKVTAILMLTAKAETYGTYTLIASNKISSDYGRVILWKLVCTPMNLSAVGARGRKRLAEATPVCTNVHLKIHVVNPVRSEASLCVKCAVPPLTLTVNDGSEPVDDGTTVSGVNVTLKCSYPSQTLDDDIRIQYKPREPTDIDFEDVTALATGLNRWSDPTKYEVTRSTKDPFFTQLKIKSVSYDDEGVYRCRATDGTDTGTSSNVQLEILAQTDSLRLDGADEESRLFAAKAEYTPIQCIAVNGSKPNSMKLKIGGEEMHLNVREEDDEYIGEISYKFTSDDHGKTITCMSQVGSFSVLTAEYGLSIESAPSISCSQADHKASKGTTVEFTCTITGNPLPDDKDIGWTGLIEATQALVPIASRDKNSILGIESTVTRDSSKVTATLKITAQVETYGTYTLVASNKISSDNKQLLLKESILPIGAGNTAKWSSSLILLIILALLM